MKDKPKKKLNELKKDSSIVLKGVKANNLKGGKGPGGTSGKS